jgi:hypothetical protein
MSPTDPAPERAHLFRENVCASDPTCAQRKSQTPPCGITLCGLVASGWSPWSSLGSSAIGAATTLRPGLSQSAPSALDCLPVPRTQRTANSRCRSPRVSTTAISYTTRPVAKRVAAMIGVFARSQWRLGLGLAFGPLAKAGYTISLFPTKTLVRAEGPE